jgi:hypothetical protein
MVYPEPARDLERAREDAIQSLGVHFASDDFSVDELDRRLTLAIRAKTRAELSELLADLPVLPDYARGPEPVGRTEVVTSRDVPGRSFIGAVMGGTARKGAWLVPQQIKVLAIMGGVELDFSAARFGPGITDIEIFTLMGGVDVVVPHGVRVEAMGVAIMGGFEASAGDVTVADPTAPVIRLSGLALMGGVEARNKKPCCRKLRKLEKRLNEMKLRLAASTAVSE